MRVEFLQPFGMLMIAISSRDITTFMQPNALRELTKKYRLVILRGFDPLEKDALVNYAKQMGPLLEWEFGNVMEMRAHEAPKNYLFTHGHVPFHWDGAFHQTPRYLLFHCIEAPAASAGGETLFTDTSRIWSDASAEEKSAWSQRQITYTTEKLAHYGGKITVPLVGTHIDTSETILRFAEPVPAEMLNPVQVEVAGMSVDVASQFIKNMAARCYHTNYCYTHTWQKNDFLIADNNALIHARHAFKHFTPRHLRRIQVL